MVRKNLKNNNPLGIYVHIPFCSTKCPYCDFHTYKYSPHLEEILVNALIAEITIKKNFIPNTHVNTIYFGGGTPSLLSPYFLEKVLNAIVKNFTLADNSEISLEANPENLTAEKAKFYKSIGINRISIGVQSFSNSVLAFLGRTHLAEDTIKAIEKVHSASLLNISIDLIIGVPINDPLLTNKNLSLISCLPVSHVSIYSLTIEKNTYFEYLKNNKNFPQKDETLFVEEFFQYYKALKNLGFEHYEISNYAKKKNYCKHNLKYWQGEEWLGLGPSAVSSISNLRITNIKSTNGYIQKIKDNKEPFTIEELSVKELFLEYIMMSLRTKWGAKLKKINSISPEFVSKLINFAKKYRNFFLISPKSIRLKHSKWLILDEILVEIAKELDN